MSGKLCDVRNEQITGETAVAEIRSDLYPIGLKIIFAKENSEWKMTNRNVYASGLSTEPKPCELSLQQSPEIRGLRLGMNVQGIKSIYPKAEIVEGLSDPGSMFKKSIILDAQDIPSPLAQNLKDIFIELNDKGYITNISVDYDDSIIWTSTTEFTDSVSIGLNLPKSIWRCPPELRCSSPFVQRDARCVGFKMSAGIIGNKPFLSLEYNMPPPVSENEKKKKAFKP